MNNNKKWEILSKLKTGKIVNSLLKNRGLKTKRQQEEFFNPVEPFKLSLKNLGINQKEVDKAISRIKKAKTSREKVIIYGDYDADGICGTAVLWETLYGLGIDVLPYIPERFSEGYGIKAESIKNLQETYSNLKLIITVDNGVVANKAVEVANKLGIDVIICDHHRPRIALTSSRGLRPRARLPKTGIVGQVGRASIRGKERYDYPNGFSIIHTTKICGTAIAWILVREIGKRTKNEKWKMKDGKLLELVAIGTVADQMPLVQENRSLAKYGLEELRKTKRVGLLALFDVAGINKEEIGTYEINYMIAPRLNAMGRLEHAIESLRLLCTKDKNRARNLALTLNRTNFERQRIVDEVILHARKMVVKGNQRKVMVLAHESYHEGVIGLAAGKLVEEFYRPAIILSRREMISEEIPK